VGRGLFHCEKGLLSSFAFLNESLKTDPVVLQERTESNWLSGYLNDPGLKLQGLQSGK
jgi:hypothetical protein